MKITVTSFKRSHACTATLSAPNPAAGRHQPPPPLETSGHSQASLGQSPMVSLLPSPGSWYTKFCLCPPRVYLPVLCKFWQLFGGVKGNLLQEGLCHTQVGCIQRALIPWQGISKLKWTEMGESYSDDHYMYYCGQESLRKNGVAIIVNKRVRNTVLRCSLKNNRMCTWPKD